MHLSAYVPFTALSRLFLIMTALGFFGMAWDKLAAFASLDRISERTLTLVAAGDGFLGVIAGGLFLRHKTLRPGFWVPVGLAAFLWAVFLIAYFVPWLLP